MGASQVAASNLQAAAAALAAIGDSAGAQALLNATPSLTGSGSGNPINNAALKNAFPSEDLTGFGFDYNPGQIQYAGVLVTVPYPDAGLDPTKYADKSEAQNQALANIVQAQASYHAAAMATGVPVRPSGYATYADEAAYQLGINEGNTPGGNNSLSDIAENIVADQDVTASMASYWDSLPSLDDVINAAGGSLSNVMQGIGVSGIPTNNNRGTQPAIGGNTIGTGAPGSTALVSSAGGDSGDTGTAGTGGGTGIDLPGITTSWIIPIGIMLGILIFGYYAIKDWGRGVRSSA
jgi:hypothetical protein